MILQCSQLILPPVLNPIKSYYNFQNTYEDDIVRRIKPFVTEIKKTLLIDSVNSFNYKSVDITNDVNIEFEVSTYNDSNVDIIHGVILEPIEIISTTEDIYPVINVIVFIQSVSCNFTFDASLNYSVSLTIDSQSENNILVDTSISHEIEIQEYILNELNNLTLLIDSNIIIQGDQLHILDISTLINLGPDVHEEQLFSYEIDLINDIDINNLEFSVLYVNDLDTANDINMEIDITHEYSCNISYIGIPIHSTVSYLLSYRNDTGVESDLTTLILDDIQAKTFKYFKLDHGVFVRGNSPLFLSNFKAQVETRTVLMKLNSLCTFLNEGDLIYNDDKNFLVIENTHEIIPVKPVLNEDGSTIKSIIILDYSNKITNIKIG
jgi:hypothetical protein